MNLVRVGVSVRALRRRLGWRQLDLAARVGTTQQSISRIERGRAGAMAIDHLERAVAALGADLDVTVRWRGGTLDRLLDARHATLSGVAARRLAGFGWVVIPEVTYSAFGERGSIDLLAWRVRDGAVLVVEIKTELTSIEATLRKHDEKVRLARGIAQERFGVVPRAIGRLLVLPDTGGTRRRLGAHASVLDPVYPLRGRAAAAWLGGPGSRSGVTGGAAGAANDRARVGTSSSRPGGFGDAVNSPRGVTRGQAAGTLGTLGTSGAILLLPLTPGVRGGSAGRTPDRVRVASTGPFHAQNPRRAAQPSPETTRNTD